MPTPSRLPALSIALKILALGSLSIFMSACVTTPRAMAPQALDELRAAGRISVVRLTRIDVDFNSAGDKFAVGLIAAGLPPTIDTDEDVTDSIFAKYELSHPAKAMETTLRTALRDQATFNNLSEETRVVTPKDAAIPAHSSDVGDYELRVGPVLLFISEHAIRRPRYEILVSGDVAFIRKKDNKPLWAARCSYFERDDKRLIFDPDPFADNAAKLREVLPIATEGCAKKLEAALLNKPK